MARDPTVNVVDAVAVGCLVVAFSVWCVVPLVRVLCDFVLNFFGKSSDFVQHLLLYLLQFLLPFLAVVIAAILVYYLLNMIYRCRMVQQWQQTAETLMQAQTQHLQHCRDRLASLRGEEAELGKASRAQLKDIDDANWKKQKEIDDGFLAQARALQQEEQEQEERTMRQAAEGCPPGAPPIVMLQLGRAVERESLEHRRGFAERKSKLEAERGRSRELADKASDEQKDMLKRELDTQKKSIADSVAHTQNQLSQTQQRVDMISEMSAKSTFALVTMPVENLKEIRSMIADHRKQPLSIGDVESAVPLIYTRIV